MTPYNHLRSQHCNASWRGQFMYIAHFGTAHNSRSSRVETFPRSYPKTTFQVYKHFDLTGNRTTVAWIEIQSAQHYTVDPHESL